jgi:phospholipid/cholesterol/gamma-HCH transport system substrate-binding protein
MRRLAVIAALVVAVAAFVASGAMAGDGDDGAYEVRAIFDNGAFLVPGEEVRIAGAKVGTVAEVDVSEEDEAVHEDGSPEPGKAVVVLRIDDAGFKDFRADASCLIRPQSLIGEKFVECQATQPRAPGSEPPPSLAQIADGEPGEGQYLLPLESNGKAVDLDLVNNIMREPYPDRFRLILNDLGAGLAARGEDLAEIVERSNPALRETNEVLAILARQNRQLADLARDGARSLAPLARERDSLSGFINEAETVAAASAERSDDIEAGFERLPGALRELRPTMTELSNFADEATPVFSDLGDAAPSLTRATRALGPFSRAGTGALTTLGDAAVEAEDPLIASDPVVLDIRRLAKSGKPAAKNLARLLRSLRETDGFEFLTQLIYFTSGSINAFDSYGHFLRALLPTNNCVDYELVPEPGCDANFSRSTTAAAASARGDSKSVLGVGKELAQAIDAAGAGGLALPEGATAEPRADLGEAEAFLDYLIGDESQRQPPPDEPGPPEGEGP